MDDDGWTKTRRQRVVRNRPTHFFTFRDARRIIADLIIDGQLDMAQRKALASMLFPQDVDAPQDKINLFDEIREYLLEKLLPRLDLTIPLITWLVDLEVEGVREALQKWLKRMQ